MKNKNWLKFIDILGNVRMINLYNIYSISCEYYSPEDCYMLIITPISDVNKSLKYKILCSEFNRIKDLMTSVII